MLYVIVQNYGISCEDQNFGSLTYRRTHTCVIYWIFHSSFHVCCPLLIILLIYFTYNKPTWLSVITQTIAKLNYRTETSVSRMILRLRLSNAVLISIIRLPEYLGMYMYFMPFFLTISLPSLDALLGYSAGDFHTLQLIFLRCMVPWSYHQPPVQYIPRNMHTVLLCFALLWLCNRS